MNSPATTTKTRESNMELLRIVAMLLIMLIHASNRALPTPDAETIASQPSSAFLLLLTRSFSIVGVDVFVMLSGWFGIRPRWSRLGELLFQVVFFSLLCLGGYYAFFGQLPCPAGLCAKTIVLLDPDSYWFIKCYLALYLFAPVLNAFVESASKQQFATVLLTLFGFQFAFGWVFEATSWLCAGYSLPFFMCLYLLARYMRLHQPKFAQFSKRTDLGIYLATVVVVTITVFFMRRYFNLGGVLYFYNSPTTILAATYLLLFFSKLSLRSRLTNWIAASALAVYLTHSNNWLGLYYDSTIQQWFATQPRITFILSTALLIVAVYAVSILLDKLRIWLYQRIFHQSK